MAAMPETDTLSQIARDAGTLIVARSRRGGVQLLMVERAATMSFAGGAMVFPGGRVDEGDRDLARSLGFALEPVDLASRIAAIRETIEECGLALTGPERALPGDRAELVRRALRAGRSLGSVIAEQGLSFDFETLVPFARWCPPPGSASKRFDTRFYLAIAGEAHGELIPDGGETAGLGWFGAREMLDRADRGEARIIFPTRCNLERLAQFDTIDALLGHARAHPVGLVAPWTEMRDGTEHLCIPEGLGYPITSRPAGTLLRG